MLNITEQLDSSDLLFCFIFLSNVNANTCSLVCNSTSFVLHSNLLWGFYKLEKDRLSRALTLCLRYNNSQQQNSFSFLFVFFCVCVCVGNELKERMRFEINKEIICVSAHSICNQMEQVLDNYKITSMLFVLRFFFHFSQSFIVFYLW